MIRKVKPLSAPATRADLPLQANISQARPKRTSALCLSKRRKEDTSLKSQLRPWVSWGLAASFLLAILTGIILSYPFREDSPLVSTVGIEAVVPFGYLFRYLHYYTGQFTFLLLVWHTTEALLSKAYERRSFKDWFLLTSTYPLTILALFTGYIVRGDETGFAAGRIAENLAASIPFLGSILNRIFFAVTEEGVHRAYMAHVFFSIGVLVALGIWHFRPRRLSIKDLSLWATAALSLSFLYPPALEAPFFSTNLKGPWFFLGVQELLRHLSPFWAGILFPLLPLLALGLYPKNPRVAFWGLLGWHLVYFFLLLRGLWR